MPSATFNITRSHLLLQFNAAVRLVISTEAIASRVRSVSLQNNPVPLRFTNILFDYFDLIPLFCKQAKFKHPSAGFCSETASEHM